VNQDRDFSLLIFLLIPGFIVLLGVAHRWEVVKNWIRPSAPDAPLLGGRPIPDYRCGLCRLGGQHYSMGKTFYLGTQHSFP
jgi:hypothetical protein